MTAEGVLHVPGRIADARLPVEPRLAQQLSEQPRIDVAPIVVADVDDEPLAVEDRVELARPLVDVSSPWPAGGRSQSACRMRSRP